MSSGRRPSACTSTSTGTGHRPASSGTARARPPDESRLGWMPCASSRSSLSAMFSMVMVPSSSVASCTSSVSLAVLAARRSRIPSDTRCCCAPSCRSRSMRRLASTPASTMRWRDWRTCSRVRSISERRRPLSTESRSALETPSRSRMLSVSTLSCRMSAIGMPVGEETGSRPWRSCRSAAALLDGFAGGIRVPAPLLVPPVDAHRGVAQGARERLRPQPAVGALAGDPHEVGDPGAHVPGVRDARDEAHRDRRDRDQRDRLSTWSAGVSTA